MTELITIELVLKLLSVVIAVYSVIALIVGGRGIVKARREAYENLHKDFTDLKHRVRDELRKDKFDE
jgi:hypothetical protein